MNDNTAGGDYAAFTRFVAHREDTQLPYLRIVEDEHADCTKLPRCWLLDSPSEPNPLLDQLMSDALTRLYLTADGATGKLKERVSEGSATSTAPTSGNWTDVGEIERAYRTSRTHRRRLALIKEAQTLVVHIQHARTLHPADERGTDAWKAKVAADSRSLRMVAEAYGINHQTVANYRRSHGAPSSQVSNGLRKQHRASTVSQAALAV